MSHEHDAHNAPGAPDDADPTLLTELKDAVSPRSALLVLGVLALGVLFIASYAGAFHNPKPKDVAFAVVAPERVSGPMAEELNKLPGSPLDTRTLQSAGEARKQLMDRKIYGALVVDPRSTEDELLVATGGGAAVADALAEIIDKVESAQQPARFAKTVDVAPVGKGDARGLSAFYLVVGWCVAGYLCAAILAISYGARPQNLRRAIIRLGVLAVYAIAAGILGAVVIGAILGALPGSLVGLWWLGALIVFAAGATTFAFQGMAGIVGIGLTILVIVIAGNPSAGGAYQYPLLPPFWRDIGPALIPGPGTWAARSIAYFDGRAMLGQFLVLGAWALCGTVITLVFSTLKKGREKVEASEVRQ